MKRFCAFVALMGAMILTSCSEFDDSRIWDKLDNHESRISQLEELCKQMNTNISSLQTIVNALQENNYITNVSPIRKDGEVIGYTITFAHSDTITIYHGEDGENGKDGKDGKDGYTPQIGVMKDIDNIYYWTVDGEWLLDGTGNKIQAIGTNGADGAPGNNAITPRLKIENDYWHVSYDEGATWEQLGKATGENGSDGADSDSIFTGVTQDDEFVYFNLADGTMITLPKHDKENIQFEDLKVKAICCMNWDVNNDGELSYEEAAAVETIGTTFKENTEIITFTELKYFIGMKEIPANAFTECSSLWKITLPSSVSTIGGWAFNNCNSLLSITISSNIKSIETYAFNGCIKLKKLNICNGISSIGEYAFKNCNSLENIVLPDSVIEIGDGAFCQCRNLKDIILPNNLTSLASSLFSGCDSLSEFVIPESVTTIYSHAFYDCTSLKSITIPKYVYSIESRAFTGCSSLQYIYCKPTTPPKIYYPRRTSSQEEYKSLSLPKNDNMLIYVSRDAYNTYLQYSSPGYADRTAAENWYFYESYIVPYDF